MIRIVDLGDGGLSAQEVLNSIASPEGVILRRDGRVIARLEPADELDLDDEVWSHAPEQVEHGKAARRRFETGASISHEEVKRQVKP